MTEIKPRLPILQAAKLVIYCSEIFMNISVIANVRSMAGFDD